MNGENFVAPKGSKRERHCLCVIIARAIYRARSRAIIPAQSYFRAIIIKLSIIINRVSLTRPNCDAKIPLSLPGSSASRR